LFAVPELTRSTDIKLNARVLLQAALAILSFPQSRGLADDAPAGAARSGVRRRCLGGGPAYPHSQSTVFRAGAFLENFLGTAIA